MEIIFVAAGGPTFAAQANREFKSELAREPGISLPAPLTLINRQRYGATVAVRLVGGAGAVAPDLPVAVKLVNPLWVKLPEV